MATDDVMRIAASLSDLVQIPSVNPLQAGERSGPGGETDLATAVGERAADVGADVELDEVIDGRSNVYAVFAGDSDRTIAVDVHLDTVGVEHMDGDPFDGRIADGRVYGRGSVDTKATFAVVLDVLNELKAAGKRPSANVMLVGTVAEEAGGLLGGFAFRRRLLTQGMTLDRAIVAEPTLCAPVHGHKGALGLEVDIHGSAAHSSQPHLGCNAISAAARVVTAIDGENERLQAAGGTTAVGPGTTIVAEIGGGVARNIVPPACELYVGRRLAPGEAPADIETQLGEIIRRAAAPADVEVRTVAAAPAFYTDPSSELVVELAALSGTEPTTATYGSNALCYDDVIDQHVVFGPGSIDQAHQAVEWIELSELGKAAEIYRRWFTAA